MSIPKSSNDPRAESSPPSSQRRPITEQVAQKSLSEPTVLRVLVIDDEPLIGAMIARVLRRHRITLETRAREALERLRAGERFDHILCDVIMPCMSGVEFYRELGTLDPGLQKQVTFITGGGYSADDREFLAKVENRILQKPFDPQTLMRAVVDGE